MKRSFASLDPQEALHVAIFIEERNADIYHRLAQMFVEFRDPESLEIAGVFRDMAAEERGHGTLLQSKYNELYGNRSCSLTEEDLLEFIEVPRLEKSDLLSGVGGNARKRALQVALDAEESAQTFYKSLAATTAKGPLQRLYGELASMEDGHVIYIQRKLSPQSVAEKDTH